ncbi:MAG: N-formylglutamate amidohydrolase [Bosea sp. (in: a-proteobacteria)]
MSERQPGDPAPDDLLYLPTEALGHGVFTHALRLHEPTPQTVPVVVDAPHAGRQYPASFIAGSRLSAHSLRRSEDAYVDLLFQDVVKLGAPLLVAEFPRAYLDVNREPYELDPRMFEGRLPGFANTRSVRVAGGLGTIPRIVGDGQDIYRARLPVNEALMRIDELYRPYHATLRDLISRTAGRFGAAILVDTHSMPASSLTREGLPVADIVLGDRYGTSAAPVVVDIAESTLRAAGFRVARNRPYAGGYITEAYGEPQRGRHALQIEVTRALYMDEQRIEPHAGFDAVRAALRLALAAAFEDWTHVVSPRQLAAE